MPANVWQATARNKNWRIGRSAPSNSVGANGEFWLDDATGDLYEKINGIYTIVPVPGGGGGAVSSVFGRTGAVTAQAGDYNATQVGLGNVTNDAQLKRAAGDFSTFSSKAPVSADVLLLEDSAASGAKKHATVGSLTQEPVSPFLPQAGSDSWNDEFSDGSPDLAARGWTVEQWSTGTPMTRVGDVTWHAGASTGTTEYRSTIVGSSLWIQTGANALIYKTFAAGRYCFAARMGPLYLSPTMVCKLWAYHSTRVPATPERNAYGTGHYATDVNTGVAQFIYTDNAGGQVWNTFGNTYNNDSVPQDVWVTDLRKVNACNQMSWNWPTMRSRWRRESNAVLPTEVIAAGIQVSATPTAAPAAPNAVCVSWIRRVGGTPV